MFCTKCGANLPDGTKFCTTCGAPIEGTSPVQPVAAVEPAAPVSAPDTPAAEPKTKESAKIDVAAVKDQLVETLKPVTNVFKSIFSKKIVRFGVIAGIVLLLVAGIVGAILFGGNGFVSVKQDVQLEAEDGTLNIIVNGKVLKDTIDLPVQRDKNGEPEMEDGKKQYYEYTYVTSMDGKIAAIWVYDYVTEYDEDGWYKDSYYDGELYALKGKKLHLIAEDVNSFDISVSGKGITYTTKNERKEDDHFTTYTLNLYNVGNKKTVTVSDEAAGLGEMSPDGKSVAYFVSEYNEKDEKAEHTLMLYSGKKSTEITDKDVSLIGLSNKGKYIYAVETETNGENTELTMYCFNNKGKSSKLGECEDDYGYMNKDHTQIMFFNEGETYIANKNKSAERVSKKHLSMIAPVSAGYSSYTYPVSNLYGQVYRVETTSGYDAYLIKKGGKEFKLVDGGYSIRMDKSGDFLYYLTDKRDLKCVKISANKNAKSKAVDIAEDVYSYEITSNRKYVYYLTDDSELMCVNGKKGGKAKEICDDDVYEIALNKKDVLFYLVKDIGDKDGELYATKNGSAGKLIEDDIESIDMTQTRLIYATSGDDIYVSTGSKKMKKLELN